ncbi:hypothetical protein [Nonomuraea sp. NPDC005650]|uniref:hypothetical protein n=1 Tax=Nonomuraea sp. NPDC005650 TaxID=3157045 RepID=UPI0033BB97B7
MDVKRARFALMWIGFLVFVPSILLERYALDARKSARYSEYWKLLRGQEYFGSTPNADASYETLIISGWIGIGLGAAWILAAITCFFLSRPPLDLMPSTRRPKKSGANTPLIRLFP